MKGKQIAVTTQNIVKICFLSTSQDLFFFLPFVLTSMESLKNTKATLINANKFFITSTKRTKFITFWRISHKNTSWLERIEPFQTVDVIIFESNYLPCLHTLTFSLIIRSFSWSYRMESWRLKRINLYYLSMSASCILIDRNVLSKFKIRKWFLF